MQGEVRVLVSSTATSASLSFHGLGRFCQASLFFFPSSLFHIPLVPRVASGKPASPRWSQGINATQLDRLGTACYGTGPCSLTPRHSLLDQSVSTCVAGQYFSESQLQSLAATGRTSTDAKDRLAGLAAEYTLQTAKEWWAEYTRVPPINRADLSRRKVVAYYTDLSCASCGLCQPAVMADSDDDFQGAHLSSPLPAPFGPEVSADHNAIFSLEMRPTDGDGTLDRFETRNAPLSARISMQIFASLPTAQGVGLAAAIAARTRSIRVWFGTAAQVPTTPDGLCPAEARAWATVGLNRSSARVGAGSGAELQLDISGLVALPRSADGWYLGVCSEAGGAARVQRARVQVQRSAGGACGDTGDAAHPAAAVAEATRSNQLAATAAAGAAPAGTKDFGATVDAAAAAAAAAEAGAGVVSGGGPDLCHFWKRTYCDGSFGSGRQLDLCGICGGGCLPPDCNRDSCVEAVPGLARIRFLGEYANTSGLVYQRFADDLICPAPRIGGPVDCFSVPGFGRQETYKVDSRLMSSPAAPTPVVFGAKSFVADTNPTSSIITDSRLWRLAITCRARAGTGASGGRLVASANAVKALAAQADSIAQAAAAPYMTMDMPSIKFENTSGVSLPANSSQAGQSNVFNRTGQHANSSQAPKLENVIARDTNLSIQIRSEVLSALVPPPVDGAEELMFVGNLTYLTEFLLVNLTYFPPLPPFKASDGLWNGIHLAEIRFSLSVIDHDGRPFSANSRHGAGMKSCEDMVPRYQFCGCRDGWQGIACELPPPGPKILVSIAPPDLASRAVLERSGPAGGARLGKAGPPLSQGGHGTHVAGLAAGGAFMDPADGSDAQIGAAAASTFDSLATAAKLVIIDLAASDAGSASTYGPYLRPPASLGNTLMGRPYLEANVRVFLAAWDFYEVDLDGQSATKIGLYPSGAREVDRFVSDHPDILVVLPAGDTDDAGYGDISGLAYCKNCVTVGSSQSWPAALAGAFDAASAAGSGDPACQPDDCPAPPGSQRDRPSACGSARFSSPYRIPSCCRDKFFELDQGYAPDTLHWISRIGLPGREVRVKPDVVAPGYNMVSARSDGATDSRGIRGCRCCAAAPAIPAVENPYELPPQMSESTWSASEADRSSLFVASGTSTAAASIASSALLIRQYFEEGYYPSGYKGSSLVGWSPSAALVKAVLVASGQPVRRWARPDSAAKVIDSLSVPNPFVGFGRVSLFPTLRLAPFVSVPEYNCSCIDPTLVSSMAASVVASISARYGDDSSYGTFCKAWDHPSYGERSCLEAAAQQQAAATAASAMASSPEDIEKAAKAEIMAADAGLACCRSWCFVNCSCPGAVAYAPTGDYTEVPGLCRSYASCTDDPNSLEFCGGSKTGAAGSLGIGGRAFVKDHSATSGEYIAEAIAQGAGPSGGALAEGESIEYELAIAGADFQWPLIVALVWTDPPALESDAGIVNDLDLLVRLVPLARNVDLGHPATLESVLSGENSDFAESKTFWGNDVSGGDRTNNVERVRVTMANASRVFINITAHRIAAHADLNSNASFPENLADIAAQNLATMNSTYNFTTFNTSSSTSQAPSLSGPVPCQTFAIVVSGQIAGRVIDRKPFYSRPSPLTAGLCGRKMSSPASQVVQLLPWQLALIIVLVTMVFLMAVHLALRPRNGGSRSKFLNTIDKFRSQYLVTSDFFSRLTTVKDSSGVGAMVSADIVVLDGVTHNEDGFFVGQTFTVLSRHSESAVVTEYDPTTRRIRLDRPPMKHSENQGHEKRGIPEKFMYTLSSVPRHVAPVGLRIGELGIVPADRVPESRNRDPSRANGPTYLDSVDVQERAQARTFKREWEPPLPSYVPSSEVFRQADERRMQEDDENLAARVTAHELRRKAETVREYAGVTRQFYDESEHSIVARMKQLGAPPPPLKTLSRNIFSVEDVPDYEPDSDEDESGVTERSSECKEIAL